MTNDRGRVTALWVVSVDNTPMAQGPYRFANGDELTDHPSDIAEGYQEINPDAAVTISFQEVPDDED